MLNSTVVALTKSLYGRYVGREGSLDTEVLDAKMMLIPNTASATADVIKRLRSALSSMSKRQALPLVDVDGIGDDWSGELALIDRQELDDAVLELMGITSSRERKQLRDELYAAITKLYREIRATEKKMQKFRSATARHGRPTPGSLADEIWESFNEKPTAKTLTDFIPAKVKTETVTLPGGKPKAIYADMFNPNSLVFGRQIITLGSPERVDYVLQLTELSVTGVIVVPIDPTLCEKALQAYRQHIDIVTDVFMNAAAGFTSDEQMQEKIVNELWRKAGRR